APSEANLRKLEKKTFSTGSVLDTKRSERPKKYCGDNVCNRLTESLERSPMKSTWKRSAEMQIPRTSLRRWMKNAYDRRTWRHIQLCMENDGARTETLDVQQSHS
ncbi:hypothetical protein C0J52_21289, partial [Blattella germanica]